MYYSNNVIFLSVSVIVVLPTKSLNNTHFHKKKSNILNNIFIFMLLMTLMLKFLFISFVQDNILLYNICSLITTH
jgi:hypothetical protein